MLQPRQNRRTWRFDQRCFSASRLLWILVGALAVFHATALQAQDAPADESDPAAENNEAYVYRERLVYYPVVGDDVYTLRRSIDSYRLVDAFGKRHDADTRSSIHWTYTTSSDASSCSLVSFHTTLDVQITLPQWQVSNEASGEMKQRWADYIRALRLHEDGHVQNGRMEATAISQLLQAVGPHADCGLLDRDVKEQTDRIHRYYEASDIDYDRRTDHGRTQGASFP
jgi:predicted secreted Zn-dependent protease